MDINSKLNQKCIYWALLDIDETGAPTLDEPVELDCRWEDRTELFINSRGEEARSISVVYLKQDVDIGGFLYLGNLNEYIEINPQEDAHPIEQFHKIPDFRAEVFLRKAFL